VTNHPRGAARRAALAACLALGAAACGRPADDTARRDTLTQRQRDSAVAASRLPGAGGVGAALRAQDSAARRKAQLDSLAKEP
jgi:hypothetical protein